MNKETLGVILLLIGLMLFGLATYYLDTSPLIEIRTRCYGMDCNNNNI